MSSSYAIRRSAEAVATVLLEGGWTRRQLERRLQDLAGGKRTWISSLVSDLSDRFAAVPSHADLASHLHASDDFRWALRKSRRLRACKNSEGRMAGIGPALAWRLPSIASPEDLAIWLGLPLGRVLKLADARAEFRRNAATQNYRYRWVSKRSGGYRLIESPKESLKRVQADLLGGILRRIPAHCAAHGYCLKRNTTTYAAPHVQRDFVMRMDLKDFFPSVNRHRVESVFRAAGYPSNVAHLLGDLTTNVTPRKVFAESPSQNAVSDTCLRAHLPQGAPTSPMLANLVAYRLDCRLDGLAKKFEATYTRYADDLLFSGSSEFGVVAKRFHVFVLSIILDEGFQIQPRKTRFMRKGQRQWATGLILNERLNTPRKDYDRLKAILHNCERFGVESQNRDENPAFRESLLGQINYHAFVNPARGSKLKAVFARVFPTNDGMSNAEAEHD